MDAICFQGWKTTKTKQQPKIQKPSPHTHKISGWAAKRLSSWINRGWDGHSTMRAREGHKTQRPVGEPNSAFYSWERADHCSAQNQNTRQGRLMCLWAKGFFSLDFEENANSRHTEPQSLPPNLQLIWKTNAVFQYRGANNINYFHVHWENVDACNRPIFSQYVHTFLFRIQCMSVYVIDFSLLASFRVHECMFLFNSQLCDYIFLHFHKQTHKCAPWCTRMHTPLSTSFLVGLTSLVDWVQMAFETGLFVLVHKESYSWGLCITRRAHYQNTEADQVTTRALKGYGTVLSVRLNSPSASVCTT